MRGNALLDICDKLIFVAGRLHYPSLWTNCLQHSPFTLEKISPSDRQNNGIETTNIEPEQSFGNRLCLNTAVVDNIPSDVRFVTSEKYGSYIKLIAETENREPRIFFLKKIDGERGRPQFEAEFTGMMELRNLTQNFVPKPYAWGRLKDVSPPSYFYLMEFRYFANCLPDPVKLASRLAELHRKSESPTGKFGFHMTTYDGARTQTVDWDSSWTSFFSNLLTEAYRQDTEKNGCWRKLDTVFNRTISHLIPRLIGVLESEGRSVKPCLIHGDLWDGNVGTDIETGDPWIYDAAVYYAHNEMELGIWRTERHKLRARVYRDEYFQIIAPSEPADECDDRNLLYSAKTNFMHSACVVGSPSRQLAYNDLLYLIEKYVPWTNEPDESPV